MRPGGFLLTNVLLHVATVLGVHALGKRLLHDEWAAFLAAAIFALQPAHAEVIGYVSGRSTGLMAALFVWGFVAWEAERRRTAIALFVAACLAKEVALVFPLFLAVREMARPREIRLLAPGVRPGQVSRARRATWIARWTMVPAPQTSSHIGSMSACSTPRPQPCPPA